MGGLNLATLLLAAFCLLMERTTPRVLLVSTGFYAWGFLCLFLCDALQWDFFTRLLVAVSGVAFASWALFSPGYGDLMAGFPGQPRDVWK